MRIPLDPGQPGFQDRVEQRLVVAKLFGEFLIAAKKKSVGVRRVPGKKDMVRAAVSAITAQNLTEKRRRLEEKKKKLMEGLK